MSKILYALARSLPLLVVGCTGIVSTTPTETLTPAASAGSGSGGSIASSGGSGANGGSESSAGSASATPVDPSNNGLPCDVTAMLQHYCVGCHASPPSGGAPQALTSYANFVETATSDPTQKVGALSVSFMQSGVMPPKPATAPTASEQAAFAAWVTAGMPQTACTTMIDAGVVATNPYDTPPVCTSMTNWKGGDRGSNAMHPGGTCIACHAKGGEGPRYAIAGTVFPSAHEPTDCNGTAQSSSGAVSVLITEATGTKHTLSVNSVGNFYYQGSLATPYQAQVQAGSAVRVMSHPQISGDCNGCHTVDGASTVTGADPAPGRIMSP